MCYLHKNNKNSWREVKGRTTCFIRLEKARVCIIEREKYL